MVVPCYNVSKTIKRCINSIKKQTYKELEVILVDDGSTDNTKNVIKDNINDARFKYFYKKNGGLSSARNYGLEKAKGKYICFIDSDDYIEKDYVQELYNSIKENNSDISVCWFNRVYENKININKIEDNPYCFLRFPAAWNKMYKTELFRKNNILYPLGKWYEDLGTFPKLMFISDKISVVNKPLYNYIQNSSSIMHTYDDRIYQIYDILEDIENYAKKNNVYDNNEKYIEFIAIYHILVGTIFRCSFRPDFNIKSIRKIVSYVNNKYPNWYKNSNDVLDLKYKLYFFLLKRNLYGLVYILLKLFNRKMDL